MIRMIVFFVAAIALTWCGATVKLGKRTFFGHVKAVWSTPEAQDMKSGIEEKAGPAVEKVKRGVKAGLREATTESSGSATGSTAASTSGAQASGGVPGSASAKQRKPRKIDRN